MRDISGFSHIDHLIVSCQWYGD